MTKALYAKLSHSKFVPQPAGRKDLQILTPSSHFHGLGTSQVAIKVYDIIAIVRTPHLCDPDDAKL